LHAPAGAQLLPEEDAMSERVVDVLNSNNTVIHTYPITIDGAGKSVSDADYEAKGLQAAAHAHLVPDGLLKTLIARIHVSRSGALAPYGHQQDAMSQTKQALDQIVREHAYFLWQREGCPEGRSDEFWNRAHDQHLRERAYFLWQQAGRPEGRSDEFWHRTCEFETH
jgi:Protein of unknown function (DUF2934)